MASDAPSLLDALATDFLTCPICLERLRGPKILPCLPTYCQGCLEGLLGEGPGLRCPECREDVSLPQGVAGLQTNFFVNGLPELLRPVGEAGLTCALCPLIGQEDGRPAVSRCLDCTDSLCQTCAAGHRCSRLTHAHRLASLQGYLSGEHDEEIRQRQAVRCPEHPAQEPCAGPICRECRLGPHLEHPCQTLEEAAPGGRAAGRRGGDGGAGGPGAGGAGGGAGRPAAPRGRAREGGRPAPDRAGAAGAAGPRHGRRHPQGAGPGPAAGDRLAGGLDRPAARPAPGLPLGAPWGAAPPAGRPRRTPEPERPLPAGPGRGRAGRPRGGE
ncbi:unnamed protein product, partial [Caretta caretta]